MKDPLEILKQYKIDNKNIKIKDGQIIFDQVKFSLKTETAWLSKKSQKRYDLGSLWLFLEHKSKGTSYVQYLQQVNDQKLVIISSIDQDEVLKYFTGQIDQTEDIDQEFQFKKKPKHKNIEKKVKLDDDEDKEQIRMVELLVKLERPIETKNRALRKHKSFKHVLDYIQKMKEDAGKKYNFYQIVQSITVNQPYCKKFYKIVAVIILLIFKYLFQGFAGEKKPIILVPNIIQIGNLSLSNAKKFLVDGIYQEADISQSFPPHLEIQRKIGNQIVTFQIKQIDNSFKNWKDVVAIFIRGSENEFSQWPDGNKPAILFSKFKGFYLKYHDFPDNLRTSQLNISQLKIHRFKRFQDSQLKDRIWLELDEFLQKPRKLQ